MVRDLSSRSSRRGRRVSFTDSVWGIGGNVAQRRECLVGNVGDDEQGRRGCWRSQGVLPRFVVKFPLPSLDLDVVHARPLDRPGRYGRSLGELCAPRKGNCCGSSPGLRR